MFMKKYFITGLVVLLPMTLTLVVVAFLFNLLTEPFLEITRSFFGNYPVFKEGFLVFSQAQVHTFITKVLILLLLVAFTFLLGFLARWFFLHKLIHLWEKVVHRIPLISSIYKACQDVINTVFSSEKSSFKQVVMIPFPNKETRTIGLVTRESLPGLETPEGETHVVVFVPTTPNPTSGFLVIFPKSDVIEVDMSIEEAFKYVISCGVIHPGFNKTKLIRQNDGIVESI